MKVRRWRKTSSQLSSLRVSRDVVPATRGLTSNHQLAFPRDAGAPNFQLSQSAKSVDDVEDTLSLGGATQLPSASEGAAARDGGF